MGDLFADGHACVIGIGGDLPSTVDDALGFAKILKDPERCAYLESQVQVLTGEQATRANIINALETLASTTNAESTVLVYFSGHGHQLSGAIKSYFLMPYGYDSKNLSKTAISGSDFVGLLGNIPAKKLLVLLDCCHAGGLSDLDGVQVAKASLPPEATKLFGEGKGKMIIGSSMPDEISFAARPYSVFTYALIKGLCGEGAVKKDGFIRAADLAMYASRIVTTETSDKQHPVLDIEKADNFVLAYYAGGKLEPKGLPKELEQLSSITKYDATNIIIDQSSPSIVGWEGRDDEIRSIETCIKNGISLIEITGFGGYGKSALARKIFESESLKAAQKIWVHFSQAYSFNQFGNWLLVKLNQNPIKPEQIINDGDLINELYEKVSAKSILLVLDNLETLLNNNQLLDNEWLDNSYYKFLIKWIEFGKSSQILLTTRKKLKLPIYASYKSFGLKGLELEPSIKLLSMQGTREDLVEFFDAVDGHPLLIKFVATYLKNAYGDNVNIKSWKNEELNPLLTIGLHRENQESNVNSIFTDIFEQLTPTLKKLLLNASVYRSSFNFEQAKATLPDEKLLREEFAQLPRYCLLQELSERDSENNRLYNFQPLIKYCIQQKISDLQLQNAHMLAIKYYQQKCKPQDAWKENSDIFEYLEIFYHYCQLKIFTEAWKIIQFCNDFLDLRGYNNILVRYYDDLYVQMYTDSDEVFDRSEFLLKRGNANKAIRNFSNAFFYYQEALKSSNNIQIKCRCYNALGSIYSELNRYNKAEQYLNLTLNILYDIREKHSDILPDIFRSLEDREIESRALTNLGNIEYSQRNYDKCIKRYKESLSIAKLSLDIAESIFNRREVANIYGNLGNAYFQIRSYKESIKFHDERLGLSQSIGDIKGEINSLFTLSILYVLQLNFREGIHSIARLISILHDIEIPTDALPLPKWFIRILKYYLKFF